MSDRDAELILQAAHRAQAFRDELMNLSGGFQDDALADHLQFLARDVDDEIAQLRHFEAQRQQILEENRLKRLGHDEIVPVSDDFLRAVYDQRMLTERGADNIKWYDPRTQIDDASGRTRLTKKRGICFHHTAVAGGFAARKAQVRGWETYAESGADLWMPAVVEADGKRVQAEWLVRPEHAKWDEAAWARAMGIADRYRGYPAGNYNNGVPYQVIHAANSVLYFNLPFDWVTWASNGANTWYLGFAWDAKSTTDTLDEADMFEALQRTIDTGRAEGHFVDGCEFTMHCCWTNKVHDAGADFARFLIEAAPQVGATIRLDFKAKSSYRSFNEVLAAA